MTVCRKNGWKCTPQRLEVYHFLQTHLRKLHPAVDDVLNDVRKRVPSVTRESVYRILNEFSAAGLIRRLDIFAGARYDTDTGNHLHFICARCGNITDFPLDGEPDLPPEVCKKDILHTEIRITGICDRCRNSQVNPGHAGNNHQQKGQHHGTQRK